jgi:predicted transcriptional regulator
MVREKIGCLPVVDGNQLVGIVTQTDLLEMLVRGEQATEAEDQA